MIKVNYLLFISFFILLEACSYSNNSRNLLNHIDYRMMKSYKIGSGNLLATYNLGKFIEENYIYAGDFVRIANEHSYNRNFLKEFDIKYNQFRSSNFLCKEINKKVRRVKSLLIKLNSKYNFFSFEEVNILQKIKTREEPLNPLSSLIKLNEFTNFIPLMLPEYKPVITSMYGLRKHPRFNKEIFHKGIDMQSNKLHYIYSSAEGVVVNIGEMRGYGKYIDIEHLYKFKTRYAHLKKISVKLKQKVLRGQKIGIQGNTGNSKGNHLHYEILLRSRPIDPLNFILHN